jgi:hypothetical protein
VGWLGLLLGGVAIWNFIVGMWIMGIILVIFSLLALAELLVEDDYFW